MAGCTFDINQGLATPESQRPTFVSVDRATEGLVVQVLIQGVAVQGWACHRKKEGRTGGEKKGDGGVAGSHLATL